VRAKIKSTADYVSEIADNPNREEREQALEKVPVHLRAQVEKWVRFMWAKKRSGKRNDAKNIR
jgi:hypothetical protein